MNRGPDSPDTMVMGPHISASFCRVKFLIRQRIKVLFPTFGGPTTTITIGGGSRGVRSTRGMWCFLVFMSWDLRGGNIQESKCYFLFLLFFLISYAVPKIQEGQITEILWPQASNMNFSQDQSDTEVSPWFSMCMFDVFCLFLWGVTCINYVLLPEGAVYTRHISVQFSFECTLTMNC